MSINVDFLRDVCEIPGAPGFENRIRQFVFNEIKDLVDDVTTDNMGNLIAVKKGGSSKKLMAAAHMDEIGFVVTHITDEGFLKFHTLGGFDPKTLTAQRVIVHGKKDVVGVMGTKPIHVMTAEEKNSAPKLSDYFIDLGMKKKEVEKIISIGDSITRERGLIEMGDCVNCKSLDNRVAVFILIETLKVLKNKEIPHDFYAVFTVQEEVGIRGAQVAALAINPDYGICIDTTIAFDTPGASDHEKITSLGEGTGIKIMDSRTICDQRMVKFMKRTAESNSIKWQPEILTGGGTDTMGLQQFTAGGSIAGAISVPTRHIHQVIETCDKSDIKNSIDLLVSCIQEIGEYDWSY
ncbi:MAG: endoglucanase [Flavobacteriales bacterium]|nr:endoglucanase [Flavobacteriales bacterium]MBO73579.1 endoglucanase [Flavobacteriales bacterium]|tara:strand:- start:802 stop:1851 length:1050 start_codon:yes stop_codon:yes gene_type:complete